MQIYYFFGVFLGYLGQNHANPVLSLIIKGGLPILDQFYVQSLEE